MLLIDRRRVARRAFMLRFAERQQVPEGFNHEGYSHPWHAGLRPRAAGIHYSSLRNSAAARMAMAAPAAAP